MGGPPPGMGGGRGFGGAGLPGAPMPTSGPTAGGGAPQKPEGLSRDGKDPGKVIDFAKANQAKPGDVANGRGGYLDKRLAEEFDKENKGDAKTKDANLRLKALENAQTQKKAYDQAKGALARGDWRSTQIERLGVDLSCAANNLRCQDRIQSTAQRSCNSRTCIELGGVWIDEGFDPAMATVIVKAQSDAYFQILAKQPKMKDVFRLGNHLVWVTPNKTALVIDTDDGKDKLTDEEIEKLFIATK
jgi:Ca-activated chloride channel family protein